MVSGLAGLKVGEVLRTQYHEFGKCLNVETDDPVHWIERERHTMTLTYCLYGTIDGLESDQPESW